MPSLKYRNDQKKDCKYPVDMHGRGNHGYNDHCHDVSVLRGKVVLDTNAMIDNLKRTQCSFQTLKTQLENLTTRYPDVRLEASFTQELVTAALVMDQKSATNTRTINATSCKRRRARCRVNHVIAKQKAWFVDNTQPTWKAHSHVNKSKHCSPRSTCYT